MFPSQVKRRERSKRLRFRLLYFAFSLRTWYTTYMYCSRRYDRLCLSRDPDEATDILMKCYIIIRPDVGSKKRSELQGMMFSLLQPPPPPCPKSITKCPRTRYPVIWGPYFSPKRHVLIHFHTRSYLGTLVKSLFSLILYVRLWLSEKSYLLHTWRLKVGSSINSPPPPPRLTVGSVMRGGSLVTLSDILGLYTVVYIYMTPKDTSMYIHTSCVTVLLLYLYLVKPINGKYLYKLEIYMCPYIHTYTVYTH